MSLANLYKEMYGDESSKTAGEYEKIAEQEVEKVAEMIDNADLDDEECTKLAEACELMDEDGLEFESAEEKLAAAAELVDLVESGQLEIEGEDEKTAEEFDAAGRIMARGFIDELSTDEPASLTEKLAASKDNDKKAPLTVRAGRALGRHTPAVGTALGGAYGGAFGSSIGGGSRKARLAKILAGILGGAALGRGVGRLQAGATQGQAEKARSYGK